MELFYYTIPCNCLFLFTIPGTMKINKLQRKLGGKDHKNKKIHTIISLYLRRRHV